MAAIFLASVCFERQQNIHAILVSQVADRSQLLVCHVSHRIPEANVALTCGFLAHLIDIGCCRTSDSEVAACPAPMLPSSRRMPRSICAFFCSLEMLRFLFSVVCLVDHSFLISPLCNRMTVTPVARLKLILRPCEPPTSSPISRI